MVFLQEMKEKFSLAKMKVELQYLQKRKVCRNLSKNVDFPFYNNYN